MKNAFFILLFLSLASCKKADSYVSRAGDGVAKPGDEWSGERRGKIVVTFAGDHLCQPIEYPSDRYHISGSSIVRDSDTVTVFSCTNCALRLGEH